jgi:hypothetical protein
VDGEEEHMSHWRLYLYPVLFMAVSLQATGQGSPTPATVYIQKVSDNCQSTVDVYTDADAACNHFAARGEFDSSGGVVLTPTMDEISSSADCLGITCITATFDATGNNWGGWYFMNGILGATDRQPSSNWGNQPNAGYDLTGATSMQFLAKGANGGENVQFFAFGVGYDPVTGRQLEPYPDSSQKVALGPGPYTTLSTTWTMYQFPLSAVDTHYVLGGFGWVASAVDQGNPNQPITFYLDNIQFLKNRPADPRFLVSYETVKSNNPFDVVERNAGFVYDNAVAMISFIAAGDLDHARTIADALLYAQANDRFFTDGRVRNAYQGGDKTLPPGWQPNNKLNTVRMPGWYDATRATWFEDETQVGSNTGNVAWAMLAILYFYETTHEQKYLQAADQLGNWIIANTSDTRGNGGFTGGYDGWENGAASGGNSNCATKIFVNGQCKRLYKATEHNIDLYSAFSRLYVAEKQDQWAQAAKQAKMFFLSMWDPAEQKFRTGTDEGGVNPATDVIPVDIQAWAIQALGSEAKPYLKALDYVESHHKTTLGYGFKQDGGNSCGDNTWFEGTSQVALSYWLSGNSSRWQSILNNVHSAQLASGAVPATDGSCLNTGFTLNDGSPWEYFPRAHVGATGWLALAETKTNPFHADLYSPAPNFSIAGTPDSQTVHPGGTANYSFTLTPVGGFGGTVSLSCTVAPKKGSQVVDPPICTLSQTVVTMDGITATQVRVTLSTTAPAVANAKISGARSNVRMVAFLVAWPFAPMLVWLFGGVTKRRRTTASLLVLAAFAVILPMVACGGNSSQRTSQDHGTTFGSYNMTVSGTSGTLQQSGTATLIVQ